MVIADPLAALFFICFAVGAALIVLMAAGGLWNFPMHHLSTLLPGAHAHAGAGHIGSRAGAGHTLGHATESGHASHVSAPSSDGAGTSPFNTLSILTWITWFGGSGYLLRTQSPLAGWLIVVCSSLAGVLAGSVVFVLLARILLPRQTFLDPSDYERVGTVGRTTAPIRAGGTGEIVYSKGGSRRAQAARSELGTPISRNTEVVVVRYEHGIAYVEPWQQFMDRAERPKE